MHLKCIIHFHGKPDPLTYNLVLRTEAAPEEKSLLETLRYLTSGECFTAPTVEGTVVFVRMEDVSSMELLVAEGVA